MSDERPLSPSGGHGEDDPKATTTLLVGLVSLILLAVIVIGLEALYLKTSEEERFRKVISQQPEELRGLQAQQLEILNGYRWVDRQGGVVAIPIDRAMRLLVEESRPTAGR